MSILDALTDVADDLRSGVAPDTALTNAAEEYGLNPALIRRRFEEQHKVKLEDFGGKEQTRAQNIAANAAAVVRAAVKDAHDWRAEAFRGGATGHLVGKLFEWRGEQYAFVGLVDAKMGLKAVKVATNQRVGIKTDVRKVLAQLSETAAVVETAKRRRRATLKKDEDDPCWDGYCQRGTKMKNGREVPNCVPVESAAESYTPPPAVAKQARKGLELRKQHGKGGTNVGAGRGSQLAGRKPVSLAIIKRMKAYFDRHQVDKKGKDWNNREKPSKGKIAWLLWGGDAGYAWAKKICRQAETAGVEVANVKKAAYALFNSLSDGPDDDIFPNDNGFTIKTTQRMGSVKRDVDAMTRQFPDVTFEASPWQRSREDQGTLIVVRQDTTKTTGTTTRVAAGKSKATAATDHKKLAASLFKEIGGEGYTGGDSGGSWVNSTLTPSQANAKVRALQSKHPDVKFSVSAWSPDDDVKGSQIYMETAGATMSVQDLIRGHAETASDTKLLEQASAMETAAEEVAANWFSKLSAKAKNAYIKRYPKSRFAKKHTPKRAGGSVPKSSARDQYQAHVKREGALVKKINEVIKKKSYVARGSAERKALDKQHEDLLAQQAKLVAQGDRLQARTKRTKEAASVRELIGQHKRAHEIATETVEINQHYLITTKFMHAAKRQANALGLEYSDNFQVDETVGTGLAENKITVSGEQKNVDAFKRWLDGNKPKEEGGGEKASVSSLIAKHAETAARKKTAKRTRKPKMDANKTKQARLEAKKKKLQVELREVEGKIAQCRKGRATTDMVIGAPGL